METLKNALEIIALLIWCGLGIALGIKAWLVSKRIDGLLDALDEDLKNGY